MRWYQRFLSAYTNPEVLERYYENAFDHFPSPIITAGEPDKFKFFNWGIVANFAKTGLQATKSKKDTVNCVSETMWEKTSFRDAAEKGQRCLIPVSRFYEWRWLDAEGTVRIPYYVTFRDQQVRSMAGLYSHWKDPATSEYCYGYTILTCPANTIMEYVHNHKKPMPVFLNRADEKVWLDRDTSKSDINELCQPSADPAMRAYTISKKLTTRNVNINVPDIRNPFNYNTAIREANGFLLRGEKKKAIEAFKAAMSGEATKEKHLQLAASQEILPEVVMG